MSHTGKPDDCDVCAALARQRETARAAGLTATMQSRNAEIANHRQFFALARLQRDHERGPW